MRVDKYKLESQRIYHPSKPSAFEGYFNNTYKRVTGIEKETHICKRIFMYASSETRKKKKNGKDRKQERNRSECKFSDGSMKAHYIYGFNREKKQKHRNAALSG